MERTLAFFVGLSLILQTQALNCFVCDGYYSSGTCFNPEASPDSITKCSTQSIAATSQIQQTNGQRYNDNSNTRASDIQCFQYTQHYYRLNTTEVHRGCISTENAATMCSSLGTNGNLYYYNLTNCRVCNDRDLCNSSYRPNINIAVSSIFIIIAFSSKYLRNSV